MGFTDVRGYASKVSYKTSITPSEVVGKLVQSGKNRNSDPPLWEMVPEIALIKASGRKRGVNG